MPNNIFIFLRHAETKVDKIKKNSEWLLTERGKIEALEIARTNFFEDTDIIITSTEEKAYKTIFPLAEKLKKKILKESKLNEVMRDNGKFLDNVDFISTMKLSLTKRDQSFNKWEKADDALKRFSKKIEEIDIKHNNKKILIVSHGTVINLYFAKLLGELEGVFNRFQTNTFCDYGVVQNRKVIKDIASI
jgi:probable phosphoglycerate mutase